MSTRRAFTLIEVLVVIAVISLLISIGLPAIYQARRNAERATCAARLREVGLALRSYLGYSNDVFPYASFMPSIGPFPLSTAKPLSIAKVLAPDAANQLEVFKCPSDRPTAERPAPNQGKTYFESEGTSYEYRLRLAGRTLDGYISNMAEHTGMRIQANTVWLFRDFDNFHAAGGTPGARRYVYIDGHVTDYEF